MSASVARVVELLISNFELREAKRKGGFKGIHGISRQAQLRGPRRVILSSIRREVFANRYRQAQ